MPYSRQMLITDPIDRLTPQNLPMNPGKRENPLSKSGRTARSERFLHRGCRDAVRKRELEVFGDKLLDVRAPNVGYLLHLNDTENLQYIFQLEILLFFQMQKKHPIC